ncbi:hypothetical protein Dimus_036375 [Dionaea muscipula]
MRGGMVSEDGLAPLAAREALSPSPTDGRRQPPLSPVVPTMVTGRGGLVPGAGVDCRLEMVVWIMPVEWEVMVEVGGMVSEEGLAPLAAREALRPSPTDGRRQPPQSPVEPAMVTGRGGLVPGAGGGLSPGDGCLDNAG